MYNHNLFEKKWQKYWLENKTYRFIDDNSEKFYILDMFPYPSGKGLHVGHPKGYTATDIVSRYKRQKGFNVLHPIGWDAFGLPAEQYAIDTNNHPKDFTKKNIEIFRDQLIKLGFDYDYDKEVNTTDPKYYKWTQWIFSKLYENNLAEIRDINVNWCEKLNTTLSNEEVVFDSENNPVSERGSFPVIKKPMKQWVLKITEYADKLLEGLDELDWPESLKEIQRKWIGKKTGYELEFLINGNKSNIFIQEEDISNINNIKAVLIAPNNDLLKPFLEDEKFNNFIKKTEKKSDRERKKTNNFEIFNPNISVINSINNETIPIFVSDYILNDEDDFNLVILTDKKNWNSEFIKHNKLNTDQNDKIDSKKIIDENNLNKKHRYNLKDWTFSRQRYWGEPFPILFDENNQIILEKDLPLILPEVDNFKEINLGISPLDKCDDWKFVTDENNNKLTREINTMPQWAGSSWYYLAYILKKDNGEYIDLDSKEAFKLFEKWLPVDIYIGGQEHAVLHLLYARFWHRFLYDIKVVPTKEPFQRIINQGMIIGENGEKMSKSKGNIISPNDIIETHGADALRLYEMFMGPITSSLPWNNNGLSGTRKWLDRVYRYYFEIEKEIIDHKDLDSKLISDWNLFIKNFSENIENMQFNLAISQMMIFINNIYKVKQISFEILEGFLILFSLFSPHLAEEINEVILKNKDSICLKKIPEFDKNIIISSEEVKIPIQINGKFKAILIVKNDSELAEIKKLAMENITIKTIIKGKKVKEVIIKDKKVINFVI